jgi:DNA-binding CsgD family transcriptional regulator
MPGSRDGHEFAAGPAVAPQAGTTPHLALLTLHNGHAAVDRLLASAPDGRPLFVAVDEAQWLDQSTTEVLAFAARRLGAEPVALVVALRDPAADLAAARCALTVLELGLGRYESALTWALDVYRDDPPGLGTHVLPDLVEAATRSGDRGAAVSALERLSDRAVAGGAELAHGLVARSRALLADDGQAEALYREAIDQVGRSGATAQLARTQLLYGEWLRRRRRRRDAREQLSAARDAFDALGVDAFARRARLELHATGERVGRRGGGVADRLTPQETQVARLVAEGSSNRQVAARLFISPSTVEYHLRKVFRKVGVNSRTQLVRTLLDQKKTSAGYGTEVPS